MSGTLRLIRNEAPRGKWAPEHLPFQSRYIERDVRTDTRTPLPLYEYVDNTRCPEVFYCALPLGLVEDQEAADDCVATAKHAQRVCCRPGVVPVLQVLEPESGHPSVVFADVPGSVCLEDWITQAAHSPRDLMAVLLQLTRTVGALHNAGIAHLYLAPTMLRVDPEGIVSLYPLGRLLPEAPSAPAPPSVYAQRTDAIAFDVSALACLMLHMMGIEHTSECRHQSLRSVLERMLTQTDEDPYCTADDVAGDLADLSAHRPVAWIHNTIIKRAALVARAHKVFAGAVAGLLVLLLAASVVLSLQAVRIRAGAIEDRAQIVRVSTAVSAGIATRLSDGNIREAMEMTTYLAGTAFGSASSEGELDGFHAICFNYRLQAHDTAPLTDEQRGMLLRITLRDALRAGLDGLIAQRSALFSGIEPAPAFGMDEIEFLAGLPGTSTRLDLRGFAAPSGPSGVPR